MIVSDACRVAPAGIQAQNVRGVDVFPNEAAAPSPLPVDQFFACARGNTAAEIQDPALAAGTFQALYTHALLDALNGKRPEVLERSQDPGDTWSYVRPVKLKEYLERELPLRVQQRRLEKKVNQNPEAILIAHESWISRVDASSMPMAAGPTMRSGRRRKLPPSAHQEFNTAIGTLVRSATHDAFRVVAEELSKAGEDPNRDVGRLAARARTMATPFGPDSMATECGIKVRGARIVDYFTPARAELVGTSGDVLQVSGIEGHAASVVLRFEGNVGAVVPAISGFLTALTFEDGELADVAFEPSANTSRGDLYKDHADEMRTLRAIAASAAQHGRFRLEKADAASVARKMRYAKNIDPALALYAAYALHDLQDVERIRQMSSHLRDEVGVTLFDLALLGRTLLGQSVESKLGYRSIRSPAVAGVVASACPPRSPASRARRRRSHRAAVDVVALRRPRHRDVDTRSLLWRRSMTKQLVLIHGRSQQHKDSIALKAEWLEALEEGLAKSNLTLPIAEPDVRFPFYGDTLFDLVDGKSEDTAAEVIVRGEQGDDDEQRFVRAVMEEVQKKSGITDAEIAQVAGQEVVEKGPQNWEWVQGFLKAVDRFLPHGSGAASPCSRATCISISRTPPFASASTPVCRPRSRRAWKRWW